MKVKKITEIPALMLIFFLVITCSPVGKMSAEKDSRIKEMKPPDNKGLVYIVCPPRYSKKILNVYCDGEFLGTTTPGRYLYILLTPGQHKLESDADNTSELTINIEGSQTYFVEQEIKTGLFSIDNELVRLSETEGRQKLDRCSLSREIIENW